MRPRLYLTNYASLPSTDPRPARVLTIMARPREFERGDGRVSVLAPPQADLFQLQAERMTWREFSERYAAGLRGVDLRPGALAVDGATSGGWYVAEGDALCCFCAVGKPCHRQLAAPLLHAAGWDVRLDGAEWPPRQLGMFG